MESMRSLFYFLLFIQPVFGPHFDGGSILWVPVSKNATASPVQILITQPYAYRLSYVSCTVGLILGTPGAGANLNLSCSNNCGATSAGYVPPPILGYCTGSNAALDVAFIQRSDTVNLTANDYFTISFGMDIAATSGFYRTLTLLNGSTVTTAHWNISATIDIRPRTDNGLINTPPVTSVMSPYGIPYNVPTQIVIPYMDVDGDDVRCRWGNSSTECGGVCFPGTTPVGTTLSSNCTLTITGTPMSAWYCAAIQVEDFLSTSTSLAPMSSIPIQFLIYVYQPRNCSAPVLTSPSTCVGVQVGLPTTVTYTIFNSCGSSSSISSVAVQSFFGIVQEPLVLITPNGTIYEMNITYTPLASEIGPQISCAVAIDDANIPSNQYCITFIVGSTTTPTSPGTAVVYTTEMSTYAEVTSAEAVTSDFTSSKTFQTSGTTTMMYATEMSTYTEVTSAEAATSDFISSETLQTSGTTTVMYITQMATYTEVTSAEVATSSLASPETLPTDVDETTSGPQIMSTTTPSEFQANIWILIGSFIGAFFLLALLGSCCLCYDCFWSPAARRRRRQQREEQHRFRHQPDRKLDADSPIFFRPLKAYQIYKFDTTNSPRYWNNNNERMIKNATPSNYSISSQATTDLNKIGGIFHSN